MWKTAGVSGAVGPRFTHVLRDISATDIVKMILFGSADSQDDCRIAEGI